MPLGALHQVHHFDRPVGGDEQLPLARPVSQAPLEVRPTALELLRIEGANRPRRQHQPHLAPRRRLASRVVAPRDRDGHLPLPGIGQAKTTSPRAIAPRVEQPHVVPPRPRGHHLVRLAKDTPRIAHIRPGLDVQLAVKPQPPAPLPVAQSSRQPPRQVPPLQIPHAQGHTRLRPHLERHRPVLLPRIVRAVDVHHPRLLGAVDDPHQPVASPVERRHQYREGPRRLGLARAGRRYAHEGEESDRGRHELGRSRRVAHQEMACVQGVHRGCPCPPRSGRWAKISVVRGRRKDTGKRGWVRAARLREQS